MSTSSPATPTVIFPAKHPSAVLQLTFPFLDVMNWQETISSVSFTSAVSSGVDANPSAILLATLSSTVKTSVILQVSAGVSGVIYLVTCKILGSSGNFYQKAGLLAVVAGELL